MANITPATTKGIFQVGMSASFENTTPTAVASEPRATPRAATVPVSSFFGSTGFALSAPATTVAALASFSVANASAAAARLAICSSIIRTNRLYGAQNAWRMLMGLSTIRVMVASQSRP